MAHLVGLKDFEARSSKEYKLVMWHVQQHMETVLADDMLHALIVAGGHFNYISTFLREFRGMTGADREMGEMLWSLFTSQWLAKHGRLHPKTFLDAIEQHTPPTAKEIEDAWEVESASSEDGRRYFDGTLKES
jgi:hypothetical protein